MPWMAFSALYEVKKVVKVGESLMVMVTGVTERHDTNFPHKNATDVDH